MFFLSRNRVWIIGAILFLFAALIYRIPFLLNPYGYNSDHAIVGLQALQLFEGYWDWFLWKVGYQGSLEVLLCALFYKLFGFGPYVFMSVAFAGYCVGVTFVVLILSRYLTRPTMVLLCASPLLLLPAEASQFTVFPPRGWCFTLAILSFWFCSGNKPTPRAVGLSVFTAFFMLYVDWMMIPFFPVLIGYCVWRCYRLGLSKRFDRDLVKGALWGFALGALFLAITRIAFAPSGGAPLAFSPKTMLNNFILLFRDCFPLLFNLFPDTWGRLFLGGEAWGMALCQVLFFVMNLFVFGCSFWLVRRHSDIPVLIRAAFWFAMGVGLISVFGFWGSTMAHELSSVRYLTPILWVIPFVLLPMAYIFSLRPFAAFITLYLMFAFVTGWHRAQPWVDGLTPVQHVRGTGVDEMKMREYLKEQGVSAATTGYWEAYRLSLMFKEDPIVVPTSYDRFQPYRDRFDRAKIYAVITKEETPKHDSAPNPDRTFGVYKVTIRKR